MKLLIMLFFAMLLFGLIIWHKKENREYENIKINKCEEAGGMVILDPWDDRLRDCIFFPKGTKES